MTRRTLLVLLAWFAALTPAALTTAQPAVVPLFDGQVGFPPGPLDRPFGVTFEPVPPPLSETPNDGFSDEHVYACMEADQLSFQECVRLLLELRDDDGADGPPQGLGPLPGNHTGTFRTSQGTDGLACPSCGTDTAAQHLGAPESFTVAGAYTSDGTNAGTLKLSLHASDGAGTELYLIHPVDNVPTLPDPLFQSAAVAVDDQGRTAAVYTEVPIGLLPQIKLLRVDRSGSLITPAPVTVNPGADPAIAMLDHAGTQAVVAKVDLVTQTIQADRVVLSPFTAQGFQVSTTAGIRNRDPALDAQRSGAAPRLGTSTVLVAWENVTDALGDPSNVRARRFDAAGNPIGDDFIVNTTLAGAQGLADVAVGPNGEAVVVWQGDAATPADAQDVYAQVYDAAGNPIGGEILVNTFTPDVQDRPKVRFLLPANSVGTPDPRFAVMWRDVGDAAGNNPRGTGYSFRVFEILGTGAPPGPGIFSDGFESGNTSAWSAAQSG